MNEFILLLILHQLSTITPLCAFHSISENKPKGASGHNIVTTVNIYKNSSSQKKIFFQSHPPTNRTHKDHWGRSRKQTTVRQKSLISIIDRIIEQIIETALLKSC